MAPSDAPSDDDARRDDEHEIINNGGETVVSEATTATTAAAAPTTAIVEGRSTGSDPSGIAGLVDTLSSTIDDNLRVFRTGAAIVIIGSALSASFLAYRRGVHGFRSAAQVPSSYFESRKRVRIRVARIVAAPPPISDAPGNGHHPVDVRGEGARNGALRDRNLGGEKDMHGRWGSDVIVHAEHITIFRRILRLSPRSLPSNGGGDANATFMLRMCGVSAEEDGFAFAREQLINQSAGLYCDAELLFREEMAGGSPDGSGGVGAVGASSGQQSSGPVAVCHLHRRRGVLWRNWVQSPLDPKAGLGEHLLLEGLATLREEKWWAGDNSSASPAAPKAAAPITDTGVSGEKYSYHPPALQRLVADRARFASAEERAERERKGLWAEFVETGAGEAGVADGTGKGWRERSASAVRALKGFFGWR